MTGGSTRPRRTRVAGETNNPTESCDICHDEGRICLSATLGIETPKKSCSVISSDQPGMILAPPTLAPRPTTVAACDQLHFHHHQQARHPCRARVLNLGTSRTSDVQLGPAAAGLREGGEGARRIPEPCSLLPRGRRSGMAAEAASVLPGQAPSRDWTHGLLRWS
jgi:hypothetical protein